MAEQYSASAEFGGNGDVIVAKAKQHEKQQRETDSAPFVFGCDVSVFSVAEIKALERIGVRFEALASGAVRPESPEEKHFLRVDRDIEKPTTVAERAWMRLKARREYEREQKETPPPSPSENYGMVEFDADRCWW